MLTLERPILSFDTETTGVDRNTCRILEIAFVKTYPDKDMTLSVPGRDIHFSVEVVKTHNEDKDSVHLYVSVNNLYYDGEEIYLGQEYTSRSEKYLKQIIN